MNITVKSEKLTRTAGDGEQDKTIMLSVGF